MAGGVGAAEAAAHLGAEQGIHRNPESTGQRSHIKSGEVKHLLDTLRLHQPLQVGSLALP